MFHFGLRPASLDKIFSFCIFVSEGDVTFLLKRGTRLGRLVRELCPVYHEVLPESISLPIRWWLQERKGEITFWSRVKRVASLCHTAVSGRKK